MTLWPRPSSSPLPLCPSMNVDMSERQCPSFVSYRSSNYLLGNIILGKLCLDDGRGGGMSGLRFDLRDESIFITSSRVYTYLDTYICIHPLTLFSLPINSLLSSISLDYSNNIPTLLWPTRPTPQPDNNKVKSPNPKRILSHRLCYHSLYSYCTTPLFCCSDVRVLVFV